VLTFPVYLIRAFFERKNSPGKTEVIYTGRASCVECHKKEDDLWLQSDHHMAMDIATEKSVLGNFNNFNFKHKGLTHRMFRKDGKFYINTNGPGGKFADFEITYTFGYKPLQQYLVPFEGGKLQCLPIAWDSEKNKWFHLGDTVYKDQEVKPDRKSVV